MWPRGSLRPTFACKFNRSGSCVKPTTWADSFAACAAIGLFGTMPPTVAMLEIVLPVTAISAATRDCTAATGPRTLLIVLCAALANDETVLIAVLRVASTVDSGPSPIRIPSVFAAFMSSSTAWSIDAVEVAVTGSVKSSTTQHAMLYGIS
jgi:hypothetical protein